MLYAWFLFFQIISYFVIGSLSVRYSLNLWQPVTFWDQYIPFVPSWVVVYVMYLPLMTAPLFLKAPLKDRAFLRSMVTASVLSYVLAFFVSTELSPHAQALFSSQKPLRGSLWLLSWFYMYDIKGLYFPSLHVLHIGVMAWFFSEGSRLWQKIWWWLGVITIAASAVLVKQHFLMDVLFSLVLIPVLCKISLRGK